MKKSIKPRGTSPKVSEKAKTTQKYDAGETGRAKPPGCDKVYKKRGNP